MGWRIISNGLDRNTQIRNTETGELFPLEDVQEITWRIFPGGSAQLTVTLMAVEIQAVVEEVTVEQEEVHGLPTRTDENIKANEKIIADIDNAIERGKVDDING